MSDSMFYYFVKAIEWLNPIVYLVGLCVALWAFRRCRRCGYLVIAAYFALSVFMLLAMPSINRAIRAHQAPDYDAQTRQKIDAAVQQAVDKVLSEEGRPHGVPARQTVHFPFGPILLVVGLWCLARGETHRPNTALEPTATAP
jgi:hypothetical protein